MPIEPRTLLVVWVQQKKQAGSDEAFRKVDRDYNVNFANLCRDKGVENFFLLSSMNADIDSRFLYNRVKAETEQAVMALDFGQLVVFRPSLLLGKHKGRPLESIGQKALNSFRRSCQSHYRYILSRLNALLVLWP
nr:hypothetical protein [Psychrobacter sp. JCM 18900]